MASIIWLKIRLDVLFWLEILSRQTWNKSGTRQRSWSWLCHWLTTWLIVLFPPRDSIVYSIILHFVLGSALSSLHFEVWNIILGVLLTYWFPAEAGFHVFWSLLNEVIDTWQGGKWNGVYDWKKEWRNYQNCFATV